MNILNIFNIFKNKKECNHDEYCPLYLAQLDNDGTEPKMCKNSNAQYCTKYRLVNESEWKKLNKSDKMKIIRDMNLFNFRYQNN